MYLVIGLVVGAFSGLLGLGGGLLLIPLMVYYFGMSQHEAQGTTLAVMVPPIGLLAAWTYHQKGYVNVPMAGLISIGFIFGGYFGAKLAVVQTGVMMRRMFAFLLLIISLKMFWGAR